MKNLFYSIILLFVWALVNTSCQSPTESSGSNASVSGDWLIPKDQIFDGGPGRDGIPALTNPNAFPAKTGALSDDELVVGVLSDGEARAYPHQILDWHEIINDDVNGKLIAITYCPLTGSGIGWNRGVDGQESTFGVSGLLYNSNLIPYDRATKSNWSQMRLQCVNGTLKGTKVQTSPVVETTWGTWKEIAPNTDVVSTDTGYDRPYGRYPYGDYRVNHNNLIFPISNADGRLQRKVRVLGVLVGDLSKAYRISSLGQNNIEIINDKIGDAPIVVAGSGLKNFAVAYERILSGTELTFEPLQDQLPRVMKDNEGNIYDVFGRAVEGPRVGQQLQVSQSFIAYWFAWATFYPETDLHS